MSWLSQNLGKTKEQQAATWLKQQKIDLLEKNFRCKGGEIDLIGLEKHPSPTLVFFEVKYRKNAEYGAPEEFISAEKQKRIIRCAQTFLRKHPQYHQHAMRFDTLSFQANEAHPRWLKDAFWLD